MRKGVSCRAVYMLAVQVVARLRARHFEFRVQGLGCVHAVARLGAPHAFPKLSKKTRGPACILKSLKRLKRSPPKDLKLSASCLNPNPKP